MGPSAMIGCECRGGVARRVRYQLPCLGGEGGGHASPPGPCQPLAAISDKSARKVAEAALAASEAEFRAIFGGTPVGMAQVNTATGRFLRVNRHLGELTRYSEQDLLSRITFPGLLHPEESGGQAGRRER